jgi:hypothetical protein
MELLGNHPDLFSGAMLVSCGQDVGVAKGFATTSRTDFLIHRCQV